MHTRLADEHGGVLPWFAIWLPVFMIFVAFVIDFGNWLEHRRHLQTQADAAALAGGTRWAFPCTPTVESNIETTARDYGGPHTLNVAAPYNAQVGGTPASRMYLLVNSLNFWNEGGTDYSAGGPCSTGFFDVKMTERDLPFFFPFAGSIVPAINARARVAILEAASVGGPQLLPVFVRDVNPESVAALFVSENADGSKTLLDAEYMTRSSTCGTGLQCWSNIAPADVTVAARTSVFVAVSNFPPCTGGPGNCMSLSGTVDTICTQFAVECYWADSATGAPQAGIVYVRGYDTGGGGGPPSPPTLRDVLLVGTDSTLGSNCPDGYFAFTTSNCSVGIRAEIDLGTHPTADTQIAAFADGCPNNSGCPLTYSGGFWQGAIPIDAAADPPTVPYRIRWTLRNATLDPPYGTCSNNFGGNNPCEAFFDGGTFVHRTFSGSDPFSGPVRVARLLDANNPSGDAYSYPVGSTQQLHLGVQLAGGVATAASDPPVQLRAVDTSQSAIDCMENTTYREELTLGCNHLFTGNDRLTATDPCNPPYGTTQGDLFNGPQPFDCVPVGPGATVGQFTDGIQGRILNGRQVCTNCPNTCPLDDGDGDGFTAGHNYWSSMFGQWNDGDPRIVIVFMVPFGAFRAQGRALYPITNFGAFYVSGWGGNGNGNDDPCPGFDPGVPTGWLSGHFIKYRLPSNSGGGTGPCTLSTTTPCVVVLTE